MLLFFFFIGQEQCKEELDMAGVEAQLAERSLLTPEDRGSNPIIGEIYCERVLNVCQLYENRKDENEGKRPGNAHFVFF